MEGIYDTTLTVLRSAEALGITPVLAADWYAEERLGGAARLPGAR